MTYRHILLAADLAPDTAAVAERARELAGPGTRITLVHVVEPLALAYGAEMPVDFGGLQEEILKQARQRLAELAGKLGVAEGDRVLVIGSISREILRVATERNVDLVILGSHSRHGLSALLGSTANAVLHHARCDVLAVRIAKG